MMRTSGGGGRDFFMLSVPLAILLFFVVGATGGPIAFLRLIEHNASAFADWIRTFFA